MTGRKAKMEAARRNDPGYTPKKQGRALYFVVVNYPAPQGQQPKGTQEFFGPYPHGEARRMQMLANALGSNPADLALVADR